MVGSPKEVELLSQLAAMLIPQTPVCELFRSFPSPDGESDLEPALTAYGVLQDPQAAFFVCYDGGGCHKGKSMESKLRNALLAYGPAGSHILCISHTEIRSLKDKVLCVKVREWQTGDTASLSEVLTDLRMQVSLGLGSVLCPEALQQLEREENSPYITEAEDYNKIADALRDETSRQEISRFLCERGFGQKSVLRMQKCALLSGKCVEAKLRSSIRWRLSLGQSPTDVTQAIEACSSLIDTFDENLKVTRQRLLDIGLAPKQAVKAMTMFPSILCNSAEHGLEPIIKWLLDFGLAPKQIVKVIRCCPQVLGCSADFSSNNVRRLVDLVGPTKGRVGKIIVGLPDILSTNVSDTVRRFLDFGFTTRQLTKLIVPYPQILAFNIEQTMKPKVKWFVDLGMTKKQAIKAIATSPNILGQNVEGSLKPKLQWFSDIGLRPEQIAKVIANFPILLLIDVERSFQPKVAWLLELGLTQNHIAKVIAAFPRVLVLSVEQNLKPKVQWLAELGLTRDEVMKVVVAFPQFFSLSIEHNLEQKVGWLGEFGLRKEQILKLISSFPLVFKYSIENNLMHKQNLLQRVFGVAGAVEVLLKQPVILSMSYERLSTRLKVLVARNETVKLPWVIRMTDAKFKARYF